MNGSTKFIASLTIIVGYLLAVFLLWSGGSITAVEALGFMVFLGIVGLVVALYAVTHSKTTVALLLAGALTATAYAQPTNGMPFKLTSLEDQPEPQFTLCELVFAVAVCGLSGYLLYKFCNAHFWTNLPAPMPPPCPPTNPPATNPPPKQPKKMVALGSLCPPTDALPSQTAGGWKTPVSFPDSWGGGPNFGTQYGGRYPYQSSTNAKDWQDFSYVAWTSPQATLSVIVDGQGNAVATNYYPTNIPFLPPVLEYPAPDLPRQLIRFAQ